MTLLKKYVLYIAFIQAIVATVGSLFSSEILHWAPCTLCWYQRIFMYPLVWIIAVGILRKDKNLPLYALPLSIIGGLIALYQYLLQIGVLPESAAPCQIGVSCLERYTNWFGFITLPFLSLTAFIIISICLYIYQKNK